MRLILASASPRRIQLLHQIGLTAEVIPSHTEEKISSENPEEVVQALARQKAEDVYARLLSEGNVGDATVVIGADTVVSVDNHILGKPKSHEEAAEMIASLSGRTHQVYTGVAVITPRESRCFAEMAAVTVYPLSPAELRSYAESEEPMDKAGAYGIQGSFGKFVKGIQGDYNAIVGLPVARLYQELKSMGLL